MGNGREAEGAGGKRRGEGERELERKEEGGGEREEMQHYQTLHHLKLYDSHLCPRPISN